MAAGVEPHSMTCSPLASVGCTVSAFNVGGTLLYRGILGAAFDVYASEGSPLVPADTSQAGLGDRVSFTTALAVRPLASMALRRPDDWWNRLMTGVELAAGPSLEYLRTASIPIAGCEVTPTRVQAGLHTAAFVGVPLLGDRQRGWLSLRLGARVLWNAEAHLAPATLEGGGCKALVVMPGVATQLLAGVSYSF